MKVASVFFDSRWYRTLSLTVAIFSMMVTPLLFGSEMNGETGLGKVNFPISCDPGVQDRFNRAVALLHSMQYVEAEKSFTAIGTADPRCGMAYWGVSMTYIRPLWLDPATIDDFLKRGRLAVQQAKDAGTKSEREEAYIASVDAFFQGDVPLEDRPRAWEAVMRRIHDTYPDDVEASVFLALAHLSSGLFSDQPLLHRKQAGEILEAVLAEHPDHPGVYHYLIHAYDDPALATRGVKVAQAYSDIAPESPHALHMPSHIFVRLGMWKDCVVWNRRSADASLKAPKINGLTTSDYPHAMDYLMYGYLQLANDEKARETLQEFVQNNGYEREIASPYALAAIPARYALERRRWKDAANMSVRFPDEFPWDQYPEMEAMTWFAKGMGAARIGDTEKTMEALHALRRIQEQVADRAGECDWALSINGWWHSVNSWLELKKGHTDRALESMHKSVDLEASVRSCASVGWIMPLPAKELLGDLLLDMGKPADALNAYKAALRETPERFASLYGAGRSAELIGDRESAKEYYQRLVDIVGNGKTSRSELAAALTFLQDH